ncbi:beta-N-acetylhexosaminidase [Geminicoccaceae bacterium 1502E]|nr:beta-N-acetylhexosaminidase [Geminicoccaceae bacterium 1502E]
MSRAVAPRAAIVGIAGPHLTSEEAALLRRLPPSGVILFGRNCVDRAQLSRLTASLRECVAADLPILIDQEGGRVMRLRPPVWPELPPMGMLGELDAVDPAAAERLLRLAAGVIGAVLHEVGIDVDCAPVLDLRMPETTRAIGDRSFGADPERVGRLGHIAIETLRARGVAPVIKHLPGHGRAIVDSHVELPVVDAPLELLRAQDFVPFRACADAGLGMTAHLLFPAIDAELPATLSPVVIDRIIRGEIGFSGVLMSDDLCMGALSGEPAARACRALDAGCDLALYCSGVLAETAAVLEAVPPLPETRQESLAAARKAAGGDRAPFDVEAAQTELAALRATA